MTGRSYIAALACMALTATTAVAQQPPPQQPQQPQQPQPQQQPRPEQAQPQQPLQPQQAQPQQQQPRQQQPGQQRFQQPGQGGEWVGAAGPQGVDNLGLNQSQVRQLQRALGDQGCPPGPIDGLLGPRTRQAIQCVQQRHDLTGQDPDELLRVLNVGFTLPQQPGMQGQQRMQPGQPGQQQGVQPGQPAPPQGQARPGEDRRDPARIEDRRDPTRTEIRADTGRTIPPGQQQIPIDTAGANIPETTPVNPRPASEELRGRGVVRPPPR